ncbi:hypothetical protein J6590_059546 [Homalodisca vitripennis]|nr:hypothetical protein J6590_092085 [Homalodisca vitripennis]KAG8305909.1 hypothetical protein J6590_059546 [Homalodisca vitripennis]
MRLYLQSSMDDYMVIDQNAIMSRPVKTRTHRWLIRVCHAPDQEFSKWSSITTDVVYIFHGRHSNATAVRSLATMTPLVVLVFLIASVGQFVQGQSLRSYRGPPVIPVLLPGGFIADTEEVARARDVHFSAFARAAASAKNSGESDLAYRQPTIGTQRVQFTGPAPEQNFQQDFNSEGVQQQSAYTGTLQSRRTQQVISNPTYNTEYSFTGPRNIGFPDQDPQTFLLSPRGSSAYQGPPVIPVLLPNGYIADTSDVNSAKENHFRLVAQAEARAQKQKTPYRQVVTDENEEEYEQHSAVPARRVVEAVPVLLPNGHLADTAEVAAAKILHLQQLLDTAKRNQPHQQQHRYANSGL